jgi:hypothetical protein
MAPLDPKSTKISELAHGQLATLQAALVRQGLSRDLKMEDVLSALVLYTPAPQAAWMVREYWWYTSRLNEGNAEEPPSVRGPELHG